MPDGVRNRLLRHPIEMRGGLIIPDGNRLATFERAIDPHAIRACSGRQIEQHTIKPWASSSTGSSPLDNAQDVAQNLFQAVDHPRRDRRLRHRTGREVVAQSLGHHGQSRQLLPRIIVQILADPALFAGGNFQHFALQQSMMGNIPADRRMRR